ncbi:MAG: chromosome partitioning protein ParB [Phormidesmis priestleyi]|uniref:Chromosome partitioning protein ParB n=1 Tax=Phormidesmis priestleyi TaxID=268141 RepID=A0A2W4X5E5_9CYAN|nr:MAG: chromosome partitioning protein ParB [Phormidesmis priestleyi]
MGNSVGSLLGGGILDGLVSSDTQNFTASDKPASLSLSKIHPWEDQPRCYFSEDSIEALASSFREHGFKGVLVVRPHPFMEGDFQLVAGERRYRAAKQAKLINVYCFIGDFDDDEALDFALRENLNREDLSRLEETLGILNLIETKYSIDPETVVEIVGREGHGDKLATTRNNVTPGNGTNENLTAIVSVLNEFEIELSSFRSNYLPTLRLQEPLKTAHLEQGLSYLKAESLNRIKDEQTLLALLAEVLKENLSVRAVRNRVGQVLTTNAEAGYPKAPIANGSRKKNKSTSSHTGKKKEKPGQCVLDLKDVVATLSKASYRKQIESDIKKKRKIQTALNNLKALLEE